MRLGAVIKHEPALVYVTGLLAVAATVIRVLPAVGVPVTSTKAAAAATIATALATALTAWQAKPPRVTVITGSAATILAALAAFGLHLPPTAISVGTAALGVGLGTVLRLHLTPKASLEVPSVPA